MMSVEQVTNKGRNLLAVALVAIPGVAFLPEAFIEDEMLHKLDDIAVFVLGAIGVWWYLSHQNRFKRSIVPVLIVSIAFLVKLAGMIIEIKDTADVGDDIGGHALFFMAAVLAIWMYRKDARMLRISSDAPRESSFR